jgi:GNAT superfamily N-acetyltransferase
MIEIRDGRPGDYDSIVPLVRAFYEIDRHPFDEDLVESGLRPLLEDDPPGFVLVAEEDDEIIAYAVVTWGWAIESGGRDALLDEIYVADRSRGIGAEMMYRIMNRSREAGVAGCSSRQSHTTGRRESSTPVTASTSMTVSG